MLKLVKPSNQYKESYLKSFRESSQVGVYDLYTLEDAEKNFEEILRRMELFETEKCIELVGDSVPCTVLWLVDGDEFIGRISIRHRLNDWYGKYGGQIGYAISPFYRGKGYGTLILKSGLQSEVIKKLDIDQILITCDENNIASLKIIEKNNGIFEGKIYQEEADVTKLRYWINISDQDKTE